MTSVGEIHAYCMSQLSIDYSLLDSAYAVGDTCSQYGIPEEDVLYAIDHIEGGVFSD